ncbi:MAG: FAD:protein FMN transferase [Clostridia bacterium]|nr:FAD:protein FMN transferase [Clostridia bacterium]
MNMKVKIKSALLAVLLVFSSLSICACGKGGKAEKYTEYIFDYFDTVTTVTGYAENKSEFDKVVETLSTKMKEYHRLFDIYNDYKGVNNIKTLNDKAHGEGNAVEVDISVIELLEFSKEMHALTGGKVNIALGSVTALWHSYRVSAEDGEGEVPSESELLSASEHCDINDVVILKDENKVYFTDPALKLDVGATAKGFATEKLARMLESEGISGYVLSLGGNVRTVGRSPDGEKWNVGVESPDGEETYPALLALEREALVTSGSYRRFYVSDGVNYHHIIDPATLFPSDRYKSVSVVCNDASLGDALSTALFNMSLDEGRKLVSNFEGVGVLWIKNDGNMETTALFDKYSVKN